MLRVTLLALAGAAALLAAAPARADNNFDQWSPAGRLSAERYLAVGAALPDGRALIAGGVGQDEAVLGSAELWNPRTGQFSPAAPMQYPRAGAAAVPLRDGRVLVAGGAPDADGIGGTGPTPQGSVPPSRSGSP